MPEEALTSDAYRQFAGEAAIEVRK